MLLNLLLLTLATIIPGQLLRVPIGSSGAITLTDVFLAITILTFTIDAFFIKKSLKIPQKITKPFLLFALAACASTILAFDHLAPKSVLISSLFLIRLIAYFFIAVIAFNVVEKKSLHKWINILLVLGTIFAFIGFIQLVFFSDLSRLQMYGWDPHQMRLVSSILDPNFAGSTLAILASISLAFYLYRGSKMYLAVLSVFVLAIILTFSRSSYLAIATVVITIGIIKAPKVLLASAIIFTLSFIAIPQVKNRIIGALTLDETAEARIQSWRNALTIFKDNPFVGVGFNTYRYTQAEYGFFSFDSPLGGHSGSGSDSSILLVAATTGIIGISLFLYFLSEIFVLITKNVSKNPFKLGALAAFLGLVVDSQFVNSLFFPQVMLIFYFILGLVAKNDS